MHISTIHHEKRSSSASATLIEGDEIQKLGMQEATRCVLEECRMVLPGIQALFGFQLIAVFNQTFSRSLSTAEQYAHLAAIGMSAIAVALVMGPAAYHRQVHPESVSKPHLRASSWMLTIGMVPLMLAIGIDFYLVARIITNSPAVSGAMTALVGAVFMGLWIVMPRAIRHARKARRA